jgi:imidazolonepropionase-like amidohydrolase
MLSLYVANGVTGVRDMGGDFATIQRWRREIARGALVGPRIVAAGPYLEGHDSPIAHLEVHTPDDARRAVDSLAALGVDFVKVHSALPRETFFAAAHEARVKHLAVAGHLSRNVTVTEASDSGQRSLEHLLGFVNVCSAAESLAFANVDPLRRAVFGSCTSRPQDTGYTHLAPVLPQDADVVGRRLYAKHRAIVRDLARAGVPILAGTDGPMRNVPPGFGLHHELTELVRAGLTPAAALRAATYEPARCLDATDSLGTIAPGKLADLVLLDANPLERVENARQPRIAAVVTRGRVYDRAALDRLLREEEQAVRGRSAR